MAYFLARLEPRALGFALGFALCLGPVANARADAPSAEAAAEARRSAAREKFEHGVEAYNARRFEEAVQLFLQADAIEPSAPLSFNVARAFERLDNQTAALRWYRDYLRRSPSASNIAEVRERVAALAAALSEKGVQQMSVLSDPAGASVLVDEKAAGVTPFTGEFPPGKHHLRLRLAGYRDREVDVVLEAATPQDVSLQLEAGAAPAPATGTPAPTTTGEQPRRAAPTTVEGKPRFGVVPWVMLGAGAASLVGAVGFELARRSAESAAKDAPQREFQAHYDAEESRKTTARGLVTLGGVLLATGGVLLVFNKPQKATPQLALGCGFSSCSVAAVGSFR